MNILILLLVLLFLGIMLPILIPILSVVVLIALGMNVIKMFNKGNYRSFENQAAREERLERERQAEADVKMKKDSSSPTGYQLPRSVQDEEFFEREHRVMDVPFEETDEKDDEGDDY